LRATLIGNPSSGSGRGQRALTVAAKVLADAGWEFDLVRTEEAGHARTAAAQAVEQGRQAVVVVGGDGTINEVVNALANTSVAIGVIPAGTGNVFAREMGIPYDPRRACRMLLASRPIDVDLGRAFFLSGPGTAASRYFLCMGGVGFDAKVVQAISAGAKSRLGIWAYVFAILKEAFRPPISDLTIRLNGETIDTKGWFLLVANAAYHAWRLKMCPGARMDDGLLDLRIFTHPGIPGYLQQILKAVLNPRSPDAGVFVRRFREVRIEADPPLPVQLDGDLQGTTPITFAVAPLALRLLAPSRLTSPKRP